MLGSKKRHILEDGRQAPAIVTNVEYATVLGMAEARNWNYKLKVTLMVRPEGDTPFEATIEDYFPQFAQPSPGDELQVRYDPKDKSRVEVDNTQAAADDAALQQQVVAAAASAPPPDLAANGILGRASLVDVQKQPTGQLVNCTLTVGVRLVDGTPPYRTTCQALLGPPEAEKLIPGQTFLTVRADANNHERVALSLTEETPVVKVSDPAFLDPPARALRDGTPCRVTVLLNQRQWLADPDGNEFYAIKLKVDSDGSELQINDPVPAGATALLQNGADLPARRIDSEPNVMAIDWAAAAAAH